MNKQKEALRLALEALEHEAEIGNDDAYRTERDAIREALAEQDDPDLQDKDPELVEQHYKQVVDDVRKVFNAKRETLPAQQQEPVAWMFQHEETGRTMCVDAQQVEWGFEKGNPRLKKIAPLYTSPPAQQEPVIDKSAAIRIATALGWAPSKPWVGLTQEERDYIWHTVGNSDAHGDVDGWSGRDVMDAIEAKLREKNT